MKIKDEVQKGFDELKLKARANDPVVDCLNKLLRNEFTFSSPLRMLPLPLIEQYGIGILEDKNKYDKFFKPEYDVFFNEWEFHYNEFWKDLLHLLELYQMKSTFDLSPFEIFNNFSDHMIRIERRSLLLNPLPKYPNNIVEQKQKRLDGSEKDYKFIRVYWIDTDGTKKRMVARHIGNRYAQVEKEVADLFHNRGFAVHREYRSNQGYFYDMVIERGGMKTAVEVKKIDESTFYDLFLFDELQKRFREEYGMN
jgi:hypothetical protein